MSTQSKPPVIGSYKKPASPPPAESVEEIDIVDKRPKADTPASSMTEGIQEELKDSIDRTKKTVEKAKTYEEILAEREIPLMKAHAIVDAMLERGSYEENVPITRTSSATFRTRSHSDYVRYLRALEIYNPKYVEEQQEIQVRYFLASSLVSFKGYTFKRTADQNDEDFFESKLEWLTKQPEALIRLLAMKLSKFDQQIQTVMSEGVVENF